MDASAWCAGTTADDVGKGGRMTPEFVGLVPHAIVVRPAEGPDIVIPASGTIARVAMVPTQIGTLAGVPVVATEPGPVTGLPEPRDGVVYVVSGMVRSALAGRPDVVAPDTGATAIRDAGGQIVAVRGFVGVRP